MATGTSLAAVEDAQLPARAGIDVGGGVTATLPEVMQIADMLAGAATLPQAYRKPADIMAAALTAAQLRLPLMTVINGTHMINGKVTLSADLMAGVARGSGEVESWQEEETQRGYRVSATRKGGTSLTVTFTLDDAKTAGLSGGNWAKFPVDMCRARAISRLCRRLFPDILAGMYSPDEMEDARAPIYAAPAEPEEHIIEAEYEQPAPPAKSDPKAVRKLRAMMKALDQATDPEEIKQRGRELHVERCRCLRDGLITEGGSTDTDALACIEEGIERRHSALSAANEDAESPFGPEPDAAPSDLAGDD